MKWIDFFYMEKLTDEAAAVADAEALAASDAPIGTPALPIFDAEQLAQSDAWVADFVNVPLEQMMPFKDHILEQPLVPEPAAQTQEMYAILDSVVQTVLTDEGADIPALLDRGRRRRDGAHRRELTVGAIGGRRRAGPRRPFSRQGPEHVRARPADAARRSATSPGGR